MKTVVHLVLGLTFAFACFEPLFAEYRARTFAGPLRISNPYPLEQLHLSWAPRPILVSSGAHSNFEVRWGWSNSALLRDSYRVDAESHSLDFDLVQPLSDRLEIGLRVPALWRGSGVLDNFIDNWHKTFNLPRGDRNDMQENAYNISGAQSNGRSFTLEQDGFGFGNPSLSAAYLLIPQSKTAPAAGLNFESSLPWASPGYGHERADLLAGLILASAYQEWAWYAGLAALHFSDADSEDILFRENHLESFAALEYLAFEKVSLLLSLHASSKLMEKLPEHPNYFLYLDIGLRYYFDSGNSIALAVRENPGGGEGSADVTSVLAIQCDI